MPALHVQHPLTLLGLVLVPVAYLLWARASRRAAGVERALTGAPGAAAQRGNTARGALRLGALALLVLALASPVAFPGGTLSPGLVPVVFVLDVSASMGADDLAPDRLTVAREAVEQVAALVPGARTALVAAAQDAVVVCPLTADRDAFLTLLRRASTDWTGTQGTRLAPALEAARDLLARDTGAGLVVLASDGEDHGRPPEALIREMRGRGVRVHTVLVGSQQGAELRDLPMGGDEPVLTRAQPERMAAWATAGRGRAWSVTPAARSLPAEPAEVAAGRVVKAAAAGQGMGAALSCWLYALAAALLIAEPLLGR